MKTSNYRESSRFIIRLMTLVLVGFLASCGPSKKTYKLYQGPQLPSEETAQLVCEGETIQINAVNGQKSPQGKDTFGNVKLEILPGDYHLTVSFSGRSSTLVPASMYYYYVFYRHDSINNVDITMKAEAGHTYLLTSAHDYEKSTWSVIVRDETEDRIILQEGPFPLNKIRTGDDQAQMRRYGP
jgi:hypothetical protein